MNCPTCKTVHLVMSERQGVEIDYCPQCRGVWLDRGELDKIIDRSVPVNKTESQPQSFQSQPKSSHGGYYKKKKESFLADLFDF